jgi:hypothetical protein
MRVIRDELEAPLKTDQTTYFSMRPPKLLFIKQQSLYIKWFERKGVCPLFDPKVNMDYLDENLSDDIFNCEWLDGFNHKIVLRRAGINSCYEHARTSAARNFGNGNLQKKMIRLFQRILRLYNAYDLGIFPLRNTTSSQAVWDRIQKRYLSDFRGKHLPVIWTTPVYPRRRTAFLVQILLSMGSFDTEYELMSSGKLRNAFIKADLFDIQRTRRDRSTIFFNVTSWKDFDALLGVNFSSIEI